MQFLRATRPVIQQLECCKLKDSVHLDAWTESDSTRFRADSDGTREQTLYPICLSSAIRKDDRVYSEVSAGSMFTAP